MRTQKKTHPANRMSLVCRQDEYRNQVVVGVGWFLDLSQRINGTRNDIAPMAPTEAQSFVQIAATRASAEPGGTAIPSSVNPAAPAIAKYVQVDTLVQIALNDFLEMAV